MSRQIAIGKVTFKTRAAAKRYIQSELDRVGICAGLRDIDEKFCDFMIDVAHMRPKFNDTIITNISIGTKHSVFAIKEDGTIEDFSWHQAIDGEHTPDIQLTCAMRWAVFPQIEGYRRDHPNAVCSICQSNIEIQVDHHIPFATMKRDFLVNQKKIPATFINGGAGKLSFAPEDAEFCTLWCDYHKKTAGLRYLCALHNVSSCHT